MGNKLRSFLVPLAFLSFCAQSASAQSAADWHLEEDKWLRSVQVNGEVNLMLGDKDIRFADGVVIRPYTYLKQSWVSIALDTQSFKKTDLENIVVKFTALPQNTSSNYSHLFKTNTTSESVLNTGNWYKIAVVEKGIYKIDYDFIKSNLGIDPSTVASNQINLFGNGGYMLPEKVDSTVYDDLYENPILMVDGGDGVMHPGDYFLFYASDTRQVKFIDNGFEHSNNFYTDTNYFFLTIGKGNGKRIQTNQVNASPSVEVDQYTDFWILDEDKKNIGEFGRIWFGDEFFPNAGNNSKQYTVSTNGVLEPIVFEIDVATTERAVGGSRFELSNNGVSLATLTGTLESDRDFNYVYSGRSNRGLINNYQSPLNLNVQFFTASSAGRGYLNYIKLIMRKSLVLTGGFVSFRDERSIQPGAIARFKLSNANAQTRIWDVSQPCHPVELASTLNGSDLYFVNHADTLREYVAFDGSLLKVPTFIGQVANQNLHGLAQADYIIITPSTFVSEANRLADFHRNESQLRVHVVELHKIYNEFSSGKQDVSAIRNFLKMFYDRAGTDTTQMVRNILLFGDASFDPKDRVPSNTNYVPTFGSMESSEKMSGFCNDDFFTMLDEGEDITNFGRINTMDMGVGRLPIMNITEARNVVNKIIHYKTKSEFGFWRLEATYLADDADNAGNHLKDGDLVANIVESLSPIYNNNKIYMDQLPYEPTPAGPRCPTANKLVNDGIYKGTFLVNFTGHGGPKNLAHERVLTSDDYSNWNNLDKLPFMITATCDFAQFDKPSTRSAGENIVLRPNGGAIAMLTTTQAVFSSPNRLINQAFVQYQFKHDHNNWMVYGDAFRYSKNEGYIRRNSVINFMKFTLLGDPALMPNFPKYTVSIDSIIDVKAPSGAAMDTVKALGEYQLVASVVDNNGQVVSNFNGTAQIRIYDKKNTHTINYKNPSFNEGYTDYQTQSSVIFKGKAAVVNGKIVTSFIVPKDINYVMGEGKVVIYADNGKEDAAGADTNVLVGGFSSNPNQDDEGPIVRPFIGDSTFQNGSAVGENVLLFAIIEDESGINVSGNSIGHDMTAVLDGDYSKPYVLNDYYESSNKTYKVGYVNFPIYGLAPGKHTLTIKAWDVNNNSGEGSVDFIVTDKGIVLVSSMGNFPNPFSDQTTFIFELNKVLQEVDAEIAIYNTMGSKVRTIRSEVNFQSNKGKAITWDGTSDTGVPLPSGVYAYTLKIKTKASEEGISSGKLTIVR